MKQTRLEALKLAATQCDNSDATLRTAQLYADFIENGVKELPDTAPTPTEEPPKRRRRRRQRADEEQPNATEEEG